MTHLRSLPWLPVYKGEVDLQKGDLHTADQGTTRLTPKERALLVYLAARPGEVIDRSTLLTEVWGYAPDVVSRAVDKTMSRLRGKLEVTPSEPQHLLGVAGEGYCFAPMPPTREGPQLYGRDTVLADLSATVRAEPGVWVLHGPGGVGKTTLAQALVTRHRAGGCFADLSACQDAAEAATAVRMALGAEGPAGLPTAARALGEGLLVLDNMEQLVESAMSILTPLKTAAPKLRVLITSRIEVPCCGATHIVVPSLDIEAGRALLLERGGLHLDEVDISVADAVVAELDGLPLALELAAARLDICSLTDLLRRLPRRLDLLRNTDPARPARQWSLEAAIQWSWDLLNDEHKIHLSGCAVFVGSFDLTAAEAVLGEMAALDSLPVLVGASLVHRSPGPGPTRFRLHRSIASFARQHGHLSLSRHMQWFATQAPLWAAAVHGRDSTAAWSRLEQERDNLQAAFTHATTNGHAAEAVALATALHPLHRTRGPLDRWAALADTTVALARQAPGAVVAQAHELRGVQRLATGDLSGAALDLDIARQYADDVPETAGMAAVRLAFVRDLLGEEGSEDLLEEAHQIGLQHGLSRLRAVVQGDRGIHAWRRSRFAEAERAFSDGDRLFARAGNVVQRASTALNRGHNARARGKDDAATVHLRAALRLADSCGYRRVCAIARLELGDLAMLSNDLDSADRLLKEARQDGEVLGSEELVGVALVRRACIALARAEDPIPLLQAGLDHLAGVDSQASEGGWLGQALQSIIATDPDTQRGHIQFACGAAPTPDVAQHLKHPQSPLPVSHLHRADLARWQWAAQRRPVR